MLRLGMERRNKKGNALGFVTEVQVLTTGTAMHLSVATASNENSDTNYGSVSI